MKSQTRNRNKLKNRNRNRRMKRNKWLLNRYGIPSVSWTVLDQSVREADMEHTREMREKLPDSNMSEGKKWRAWFLRQCFWPHWRSLCDLSRLAAYLFHGCRGQLVLRVGLGTLRFGLHGAHHVPVSRQQWHRKP